MVWKGPSQHQLKGKSLSLIEEESANVLVRADGVFSQGVLKGTNQRGQTEPKRRFSLILAFS